MIHPIIDDFYSPNPAHSRSAGFAQAKGQTITGPDKRVLGQQQAVGSDVENDASGAGTPSHSSLHASRSNGIGELVDGAINRLKLGS